MKVAVMADGTRIWLEEAIEYYAVRMLRKSPHFQYWLH